MRRFGSLGMSSSGAIGRVGVQGDGSLSDVIASAVFDLDATQAASYTSGTTWSNLVTAPADGSAQTAYDFAITGATFNGSAGASAAYFSSDGTGDFFRVAANTAFLAGLQRTDNGNMWFAMAYRHADNTINSAWFANKDSLTNSTIGLSMYTTSGEVINGRQANSSTTSNPGSVATMVNGTDYVVVGSWSKSTNVFTAWINTTTGANYTWTFVTTTLDVSTLFTIWASSNGATGSPSGTRLYSFAMGNEYLDNTKAAAIIAALQTRHGRIYAP